MSDKYSIDDILAEIDKKRSSEKKDSSARTESVTEIIGGGELDEAIRRSGARTRMSDDEREAAERAEEEENLRRAESIRRAAVENERRKSQQKQKKAEAEEQRRREREKKQQLAEQAKLRKENERQQRLEQERLEQERLQQEQAEKIQFTPAQTEAEQPELPEEPEHTGFTAELSSPVEAAKLFADPEEQPDQNVVQPESEYVQPFVKPQVSGAADDDIIFHTRGDLVTTETQQLKKLQRIEEINRALLAADKAAEDPDDLVDSLNPMESREKAADVLKNAAEPQDIGDTLAVSGNDLKKMSSGETEHVKEYSPVTSRKKHSSKADEVLFTPGAQKKTDSASAKESRGSDALVASLNQKLKEQREKNIAEERTLNLTDMAEQQALPPRSLNLDYDNKVIDTSILPKTDPVAAVREAEALAARKKRRIANFMLADIDDEVDSAEEEKDEDYDEDEEEEVIDLDDENVITERLSQAGKGLAGRLVILGLLTAATVLAALVYFFKIDSIPIVSELIKPDIFLYTNLTIGILSFGACSSVITNGFSRLVKLKPDGDTLCAFAHIGALGSIIMYLAETNYLAMNRSYVYLIVSMLALCFNTVSKLCTVNAAKKNFRFVSGDSDKYYVECTDGEDAEQLARGAVQSIPVTASMRKTEMLCDFIISTYCEDVSDRISRVLTPVILAMSVIAGAIGFFAETGITSNVMNQWSFAATVFSAVLCVGASFTGALIVMLPMLSASRKTNERRAAILGYSAVEDFSAVNSVLVEAKTLFPAGSVAIRNIWDYNKNGANGAQHVTIDEAIIYAASLAVSSDSILADPLFNMLNYKPALLKKVSNCVYESGLGVSGWIGSRRVLLGSRDHMKSHGITVPDAKKESALNKKNDEVVYLAIAGEVCMLFFVNLSANPQVKNHVRRLSKNGVSLIIKTVDGVLTEGVVSELFDIYAEDVKILPAESHDLFEEHTKYAGKGSAAVSCDGTFSSLASAINGAKSLNERIKMGCIMEIFGVGLGVLLVFIFALFRNYSLLNSFWIAIYNAVWLILTVAVQAIKRI
ncbi:MAG: hypothetical protein ACI4WS_06975 [Oscillospiraceae bacterium]